MRWIILVSVILLFGIGYVAVEIAPPAATSPTVTDWFLVGLTVVLGGVGAMQAYIYWQQAILMRETLKATQESSEAAKRSADAVMTLEQSRVVLSVVDASLDYPANENRDHRVIRITYKLTNYGRTPAWIRTCQIGIVDPLDPASDGDPDAGSHQVAYGPADRPPIAPDASEDATMPPVTVAVREHDTKTQTMERFMIGNIGYVDVFGEARTAPFFWRLYWSTLECPGPGTNKYGGGFNHAKVMGGPGEYWHGFRGRVHKLSMKPASPTPKS